MGIRIETERLIIRDHIESDIEEMHKLLTDNKVMRYLPEIRTSSREESELNLEEALKENESPHRTRYFFAILEKETSRYVGEIGFMATTVTKAGNIVNLGYFINEEYWGKGMVTEAATEVVKYAFEALNTVKIETGCLSENEGSEKIMKKLGFIKEAELKEHIYFEERFCDRLEYRMLRSEYESSKGDKTLKGSVSFL